MDFARRNLPLVLEIEVPASIAAATATNTLFPYTFLLCCAPRRQRLAVALLLLLNNQRAEVHLPLQQGHHPLLTPRGNNR